MKSEFIKFSFGNLEFHGLKFRDEDRYSEEYFDKLLEDGTHYSQDKYLEGFNQQFIESIHCKLSYYYLFVALSLIALSFFIIVLFQKLMLTAGLLFILSGALYFVAWLFLRSARNEKMSMAMNKGLIDLVFEEQRKKKKTKNESESEIEKDNTF